MEPAALHQLIEALQLLSSETITEALRSGAGIRRRPEYTYEFLGESLTSFQHLVPVIDWPRSNLSDWIDRLEHFNAASQPLRANEHVRRWIATRVNGPDPDEVLNIGVRQFTSLFVASVLAPDEWRVDSERWSRSLGQLQHLLAHGTIERKTVALLFGVGVADDVDLSDAKIRQPTRGELSRALNAHTIADKRTYVPWCNAAAEYAEHVPIGAGALGGNVVHEVVQALRLWTTGPVVSFIIFSSDLFSEGGFSTTHHSMSPGFGYAPTLKDCPGFATFWNRTRRVLAAPPSELAVALRRIDMMTEQERQSDRILDLCIILEALFQTGAEQSELTYRLRLRTAHYASDGHAERLELFNLVRDAYKMRSKIAHGKGNADDRTTEAKVQEVVYRCLRKYADDVATSPRRSHEDFVNMLDRFALERRGDR